MLGVKRRALPTNNLNSVMFHRNMRVNALAIKFEVTGNPLGFSKRRIFALQPVNYGSRILALANRFPVESKVSSNSFHNILQKQINYLDSISQQHRMMETR